MHNGNLNLSVAGMEGYKQSVTHGAPLKVKVSTQNELWTCLDSALKSEVWSQAATINWVNIQSFFLHFQTFLWRHRSVDCQFSINNERGYKVSHLSVCWRQRRTLRTLLAEWRFLAENWNVWDPSSAAVSRYSCTSGPFLSTKMLDMKCFSIGIFSIYVCKQN